MTNLPFVLCLGARKMWSERNTYMPDEAHSICHLSSACRNANRNYWLNQNCTQIVMNYPANKTIHRIQLTTVHECACVCVCVCPSNGFVFSHLCYRYLHDLCECVVVGYIAVHISIHHIVIVSVSLDVQFLSGLSYNKYHLTFYICHFNVDAIECVRSVATVLN